MYDEMAGGIRAQQKLFKDDPDKVSARITLGDMFPLSLSVRMTGTDSSMLESLVEFHRLHAGESPATQRYQFSRTLRSHYQWRRRNLPNSIPEHRPGFDCCRIEQW